MKRLMVVLIAVLLLGVGAAGAQLIPGSKIIERLVPAESKGGWVKIDKSYKNPNYQKVYCITVDGMLSCDWNDVRRVHVSSFSE